MSDEAARDAEFRATLVKHGVTPPQDGPIVSARWAAAYDDWYVLVGAQWLWWDSRTSKWMKHAWGPQ
jgi:hypothetical protein